MSKKHLKTNLSESKLFICHLPQLLSSVSLLRNCWLYSSFPLGQKPWSCPWFLIYKSIRWWRPHPILSALVTFTSVPATVTAHSDFPVACKSSFFNTYPGEPVLHTAARMVFPVYQSGHSVPFRKAIRWLCVTQDQSHSPHGGQQGFALSVALFLISSPPPAPPTTFLSGPAAPPSLTLRHASHTFGLEFRTSLLCLPSHSWLSHFCIPVQMSPLTWSSG